MAYDLGTVKGSISIDIAQAVAAYAALRRTNAATDTALLESSRSLKAVGAGLLGIGAVALVGFGIAVKAAANFQNQMRYFQVVTGSSKKDMAAATQEAFKLARTSGYTAGEIAGAFVELGKAGIDAKNIVAGVGDAVAQLGAAAQIPLKDSAEIIVNTMKTFQLGAGQATKIADQLAGAANASTVDITDLAYSLRYVGGTAASLGVPLHDVLDALGQLGNAGIRGSTGGTALRKILLQLAPVTRQAREELEKLGIIQTNGGVTADKYAKLQDKQKAAIDNLRKAQERLIEVQRIQAAGTGTTGGTSSVDKQAAAARRLEAAQQRLSAAQDHLNAVQAKYSSSGSLAATAAKQATMFNQLQSAQNRLSAAELHLRDVQAKNAEVSTKGTSGAAKQIRAAFQLKNAQEAVAAAADKARKAGVAVAPGIEKLTNLFFDASGKAKPLSEIFQILQDRMKGMTQQQKVQAAELIFGNRAISSALILARQGAKGFQEFGKEMDQTSAADVMRKRLDTLSGAWRKFQGAMSVALIQAGTPAQTPLKILVQGLTALVRGFTNLPGPVQTMISSFVLLFGVLAGGLGTFILMVSFVAKAVRAYRDFKTALMFVKEIQLVQRAIALLNLTMLANPVILIIAAVVALGIALAILIIKVKPVREFFIRAGKDIVGAFWDVVRFFERVPGYFVTAWNAIKGVFSAGINWIKKNWDILLAILIPGLWIIPVWRRFHTQIVGVVEGIVRDIVKFFERLPGQMLTIVEDIGKLWLKMFTELPGVVAYWLGFIIGRLIRFQIDATKTLALFGLHAAEAILTFFEKLPGRLLSLLTSLVNLEIRGWTNIYHGIIRLAVAIFNGVVGFFERLPSRLWNATVSVYKFLAKGWGDTRTMVRRWAQQIFNDVLGFFEQLPGKIGASMTSVWTGLVNIGTSIVTAMQTIGSSAVNAIMAFFTGLPDLIYNALLNAIKSIGNLAKRAFDTAKHWGSSLWNGFKKGLFGSPRTKIEYALEDMTKTADRETKKLASQVRYLNGIAAKIPGGVATNGLVAIRGTSSRPGAETAGGVSRTYNITNNYPKPEPAGQSVERTLNNLEFVGALG